jgi:hypothetical protein
MRIRPIATAVHRAPRGSPVPGCFQPFVVNRPTAAVDPELSFRCLELHEGHAPRPLQENAISVAGLRDPRRGEDGQVTPGFVALNPG